MDKSLRDTIFAELFSKYKDVARKTPIVNVDIEDFVLNIPDFASFIWQYKSIFVEGDFKMPMGNLSPVVIDAGANIGLMSLYMAKYFPDATILAYEADPYIYGFLEKNIHKNEMQNIQTFNNAIWNKKEKVRFSQTQADAGHVSYGFEEGSVEVDAVLLSEVLQKFQTIDLLKIDIEGAELNVLNECENELSRVKNLALEVHTHPKEQQKLSEIFAILEKNGFRYHLHDINRRVSPLINRESKGLFDCQANIFAYRADA